MFNQTAYALGANRSCIRELFEYGRSRAAIVGPENVYDYSLGNPSIPSPKGVNDAIRDILLDTPSLLVHGYTSATGDLEARKAISRDLNARYGADTRRGIRRRNSPCVVRQQPQTDGNGGVDLPHQRLVKMPHFFF